MVLSSRNIRMVPAGAAGEPQNPAPPVAEARRFPHNWSSEYLFSWFFSLDNIADGNPFERTACTFSDGNLTHRTSSTIIIIFKF